MAVSMVGELNPYELFNMAMLAPETDLMDVLQGKSDKFPQDIAFSALKKKRQMKTAVQGVQAQNELSGVAGLSADNMMGMAGGGIVAFAGPDGSLVSAEDQANERRREQLQYYAKRLGLNAATMMGAPVAMAYDIGQLGSMPGQYLGFISGLKKREPEFTSLTKRLFTEETPVEQAYRRKQALDKATAGGEFDYAGAPAPSVLGFSANPENALEYPSVPTPQANVPPSVRPAAAAVRPAAAAAVPVVRPAAAAASPTEALSTVELIKSLQASAPGGNAVPSGGGVKTDDSVFQNFYTLAAGMTRPEQEKLDALLAAREGKITSGKESRKGEARGLAALQAASELLQSGRGGAASRGAAFGVSAKQAEKYLDNEQKIQDRLDEVGIAAANARLANKQGNVKLAAEMMGQAQERGLKAAQIAAENEYRRVDALLKAKGLDETIRHNMATEAATRAHQAVMAQAYGAHAGLYDAQADLVRTQAEALRTNPKGSLTEAQKANIHNQVRDDVRAVMQNPAQVAQLRKDPRFQGMTDFEITNALQKELLDRQLGVASAAGASTNLAFSPALPPNAVIRQPIR